MTFAFAPHNGESLKSKKTPSFFSCKAFPEGSILHFGECLQLFAVVSPGYSDNEWTAWIKPLASSIP
jgi:hypothetical protein